jgi:hypothetical protein
MVNAPEVGGPLPHIASLKIKIKQSINQSTNQPINQSNNQPINQPNEQARNIIQICLSPSHHRDRLPASNGNGKSKGKSTVNKMTRKI